MVTHYSISCVLDPRLREDDGLRGWRLAVTPGCLLFSIIHFQFSISLPFLSPTSYLPSPKKDFFYDY